MRKSRRYHHNRKKSRMNFAAVVVIIVVAVIMGIMTAKLIIFLINVPENVQEDEKSSSEVVEISENSEQSIPKTTADAVKIIEDTLVSGYYIQYGSFSSAEAANALISQLEASGITAQLVEKSGTYKVVGELFADKASAQKALESVDRNCYKDVFVTTI